MTTLTTVNESMPKGPERPAPVRAVWLVATLAAVVVALVGASRIHVPYYSLAPGSAVPVPPLVTVVDGPSYRPEGTVLLSTVALGPTTILEALAGWLDPDVTVVDRDTVVPPNTSRQRFREQNLQEMDISKETAIGVALEHLGFDAITGGGAQVLEAVSGAPADGALGAGDVVIAIDGHPIEAPAAAVTRLRGRRPGDSVRLTVRAASGESHDIDVVLGGRPDDASMAFLGVTFGPARPTFTFPYEVSIDSEQIGGPSAGLAFTLEVLDVLTPGELTGGHVVATTGTIELDGSVGLVGGVAQKTVAVRRAGADLFLVPTDELAEARRHAGSMRVEGVDTLDDALGVLASLGGNGLALGRPGAAPS